MSFIHHYTASGFIVNRHQILKGDDIVRNCFVSDNNKKHWLRVKLNPQSPIPDFQVIGTLDGLPVPITNLIPIPDSVEELLELIP
jgi:hypothetical protein